MENKIIYVTPRDFDPIYNKSEEQLLEEFIKKELVKSNITETTQIPKDALKRKQILSIIFAILIFIYVSIIFFHFPILTYITGFIILLIFSIATRKYSLIKYLKKEVKSRPNEKISNIVMNTKNSLVDDNSKLFRRICVIASIIISLAIFIKPRILYEETEGGYAVRYYIFGLTEYNKAEIPATYKGKKVVALRGNSFSNMPLLKEVKLPDTIKEIRGQAFKNDILLERVNIPNNLEYLGGGSFYNCKSIKEIELPDTLTYMGGEMFTGASKLEYIKLSNNLTEIRGNSFENCISLKSITIPSKVTRIGGHAFYGNTSLSSVIFEEDSELKEIGSSAFRQCTNLRSITIPKKTVVNSRAFKESPTIIKYFED